MIKASVKKIGDYYKAVVTVIDGTYKKSYYSVDMFLDRKTALKHAEAWRNESQQVGYITMA